MHFRIGSMAIPHLITLLLQLQDEGKLTLDDKLSRFLPDMPDADRITLRMLADNTSGYRDWIQGDRRSSTSSSATSSGNGRRTNCWPTRLPAGTSATRAPASTMPTRTTPS